MRKLYIILPLFLIVVSVTGQTTQSVVADKDNSIFSGSTDNSNGAGAYFFVGKNGPNNNNSVQRSLLHFDLSAIPPGSVVTSATLTIFVNKTSTAASQIELHKLLADWGEGTSDAAGNEGAGAAATTNDATWSKRINPSASWTSAGGDFTSTVSATASVGVNIRSVTQITLTGTDLVADVQNWISNSGTNFGWIIKSGDEGTEYTAKRFISRNNSNAAQRPSLSVTYTSTLPITLSGFSANIQKQGALLNWSTANEVNNDHFEIEHSADGSNFILIGSVNAGGNNATGQKYQFLHESPAAGKHFYRVIDVDKNGNKKYSQTIMLSFLGSNVLQLFPNPATSFISFTTSTLINGSDYTITSSAGQQLVRGKITEQKINVQKLTAGHYWLTIKIKTGELLKAQFLKR